MNTQLDCSFIIFLYVLYLLTLVFAFVFLFVRVYELKQGLDQEMQVNERLSYKSTLLSSTIDFTTQLIFVMNFFSDLFCFLSMFSVDRLQSRVNELQSLSDRLKKELDAKTVEAANGKNKLSIETIIMGIDVTC